MFSGQRSISISSISRRQVVLCLVHVRIPLARLDTRRATSASKTRSTHFDCRAMWKNVRRIEIKLKQNRNVKTIVKRFRCFSQSQPVSAHVRHCSALRRWLGAQTADGDCDWLKRPYDKTLGLYSRRVLFW